MDSIEQKKSKNWMWRLPLGLLFVLLVCFVAFSAGGWVYANFFERSAGLAGAAEVLWSGILSALVGAVLAVIFAYRVRFRTLGVGLIVAILVASVVFFIFATRMQASQQALLDPEEDYAGIATFYAAVEKLVVDDPYLWTKMVVNSGPRSWTMTGAAPDHQVCAGTVRADQLQAMWQALDTLSRMDQGQVMAGFGGDDAPQKVVAWTIEAGPETDGATWLSGQIEFTDVQLWAAPEVARAVATIGAASLSSQAGVRCN